MPVEILVLANALNMCEGENMLLYKEKTLNLI